VLGDDAGAIRPRHRRGLDDRGSVILQMCEGSTKSLDDMADRSSVTGDQIIVGRRFPDLRTIITPAVAPRRLALRTDISVPEWTFWELRTLNRHRVVALFKTQRSFGSLQELNSEIRGMLSREFTRAWWRGIAYGVVVDLSTISLKPEDLKELVDVRENSRGDMQWVVLTAVDRKVAVGVHTWIEAYLSPAYQAILLSLQSAGFNITSIKRDKDGLMKFLTGVADLDVAIHTFGQRVAFPEFQNDTTRWTSPAQPPPSQFS
jgi:hypothetical protein